MEGRSQDFESSLCKPCSAGLLCPPYTVCTRFLILLWGLMLQMPLSVFLLQSAVRCVQNDGQRVSLSLIHGHWALGTLLVLWELGWQ